MRRRRCGYLCNLSVLLTWLLATKQSTSGQMFDSGQMFRLSPLATTTAASTSSNNINHRFEGSNLPPEVQGTEPLENVTCGPSCRITNSSTYIIEMEMLKVAARLGGCAAFNSSATLSVSTYPVPSGNVTSMCRVHEIVVADDGDEVPVHFHGSVEEGGVDLTMRLAFLKQPPGVHQSMRHGVGCKYYDTASRKYRDAGMFLRGLKVSRSPNSSGLQVAAQCVSSHLTAFSASEWSTCPVELRDRQPFGNLNRVFFESAAVEIKLNTASFYPLLVLTMLTVVTLLGVIYAKTRPTKDCSLKDARAAFLFSGEQKQPQICDEKELVSLLQDRFLPKSAAKLVWLHVSAEHPLGALFFRWTHNELVFSMADKIVVVYSYLLGLLAYSAFREVFIIGEMNASATSSIVASAFFSRVHDIVVANVLLSPAWYVLPCLIKHSARFKTSTEVQSAASMSSVCKRWGRCLRRRSKARRGSTAGLTRRESDAASASTVLAWWTSLLKSDEKLADGERPQSTIRAFEPLRVKCQHLLLVNRPLAVPVPGRRRQAHVHDTNVYYGPTAAERRLRRHRAKQRLASARVVSREIRALKAFRRFQVFVRKKYLLRQYIREREFEAWYFDLRRERRWLVVISTLYTTILAAAAIGVAIVYAGTFAEDVMVAWLQDSMRSYFLQTVAITPLLDLGLVVGRLLLTKIALTSAAAMRRRKVITDLMTRQQALQLEEKVLIARLHERNSRRLRTQLTLVEEAAVEVASLMQRVRRTDGVTRRVYSEHAVLKRRGVKQLRLRFFRSGDGRLSRLARMSARVEEATEEKEDEKEAEEKENDTAVAALFTKSKKPITRYAVAPADHTPRPAVRDEDSPMRVESCSNMLECLPRPYTGPDNV